MKFKKIIAGIALVAIVAPFTALAHEHQEFKIGEKTYEFVVGSLGEPVIVDDKTGVDLRISSGGVAVEGLEKDLKVEIIAGDKKKVLDITTVYGAKGSYKAIFFPTIQTTLSYRVFGTINGIAIDLPFTCNPAGHVASPEDKTEVIVSEGVTRILKSGQFGCPQSKAELGFPEESWTLNDVHADAEAHDAAIRANVADVDGRTGAGLAFGLLGTVLGGMALWKTRKTKV
jgi:hypothetical protein